MISVRSIAPPRTSCAPSAMAEPAFPIATTQTGPDDGVSARATELRPETLSSPAWNSSSRIRRRGSDEFTSDEPRPGSMGESATPNDFEFTASFTAQRLRRVRPFDLQALEIFRRHIACYILTGEAGRVELGDARIIVLARRHQILQILIDEPVGTNELRVLFFGSLCGVLLSGCGLVVVV